MTDDRPTPPRRRPRAAADETGPDVAEITTIQQSPQDPPANSSPKLASTVQLNTRVSADVYKLVIDAKFRRRTSIREAVEYALRTTYSKETHG